MYLCNCRATTHQDVQNYAEFLDGFFVLRAEFILAEASGQPHQCGKCHEDPETLNTIWEIVAAAQQEKTNADEPVAGLG